MKEKETKSLERETGRSQTRGGRSGAKETDADFRSHSSAGRLEIPQLLSVRVSPGAGCPTACRLKSIPTAASRKHTCRKHHRAEAAQAEVSLTRA